MSGGIMSVATAIRSLGAAAKLAATEVEQAAKSIERTRRETEGRATSSGMNPAGTASTGGMGGASGASGGGNSMTGGSKIAGALVSEIRRIVR